MAKTQNQSDETVEKNEIVEKEQVVINENDIISGEELKENDIIDVNAPEVVIEKKQETENIKEQTMSVEKNENTEEKTEASEENEKKEKTTKKTNNQKSDSKKVKLKIRLAFTDKYNDVDYKENDIIEFEKERASELLSDKRRLVEKVD